MRTSEPTDEQILAARIVALMDQNCGCWYVVVYPAGATLDHDHDADDILRIHIDSSNLAVIEAWHDQIAKLRPI